MNRKLFLILVLSFLLIVPNATSLAKEGSDDGDKIEIKSGSDQDKPKTEVKTSETTSNDSDHSGASGKGSSDSKIEVKVEGPIINGTNFAKEIKVFDANGQEVKIEIKNVNPVISMLNQILILLGLSPITP